MKNYVVIINNHQTENFRLTVHAFHTIDRSFLGIFNPRGYFILSAIGLARECMENPTVSRKVGGVRFHLSVRGFPTVLLAFGL